MVGGTSPVKDSVMRGAAIKPGRARVSSESAPSCGILWRPRYWRFAVKFRVRGVGGSSINGHPRAG